MPDIKVNGPDGQFGAYLAVPATLPAPALVVAQEIFGVNHIMRETCDWLASKGYLACCPDSFWRIEPDIQITDKTEAEWKRAFELFGLYDPDKGIEDFKATISHLRALPDCNGKVGSIGYCLGGKMVYLMACRTDSDCNVAYYGVGLDELLGESGAIARPLLMHMASEDKFVPPEAQSRIKASLKDNSYVELHVYDGCDHAFARKGGEHYDQAAADLANDRSLRFLKENLGR